MILTKRRFRRRPSNSPQKICSHGPKTSTSPRPEPSTRAQAEGARPEGSAESSNRPSVTATTTSRPITVYCSPLQCLAPQMGATVVPSAPLRLRPSTARLSSPKSRSGGASGQAAQDRPCRSGCGDSSWLARGSQLLHPIIVILVESALIVVDEHTGGDIYSVYKGQHILIVNFTAAAMAIAPRAAKAQPHQGMGRTESSATGTGTAVGEIGIPGVSGTRVG
jgi:hypothetical protein